MIVGLGNPGPTYANTRHNLGFMVVDTLASRLGAGEGAWKTKDRARQALLRERELILCEPQSYMNESGVPARLVATWYRVPPQRMLVVYDDIDLPFGRLRLREEGSSGGHNGVKSMIQYFGQEFPRLRVGIGRAGDGNALDQVLGSFTPHERERLPRVIVAAVDACELWLDRGFIAASNMANAWRVDPPPPKPPRPDAVQLDEEGKPRT